VLGEDICKFLEQGSHGHRCKVGHVVWFNGENQAQRDTFFQTDFLNDHLPGNRMGGFKSRRCKNIGAPLML